MADILDSFKRVFNLKSNFECSLETINVFGYNTEKMGFIKHSEPDCVV